MYVCLFAQAENVGKQPELYRWKSQNNFDSGQLSRKHGSEDGKQTNVNGLLAVLVGILSIERHWMYLQRPGLRLIT